MAKNNRNIDGFIPRRRKDGSISGPVSRSGHNGLQPSFDSSGLSHATDNREVKGSALQQSNAHSGLSRSAVDQTLNGIDDSGKREKKHRMRHLNKRKLIKRVSIALAVIVVLLGLFLGIRAIIAGGNIFKGNLLGFVQSKPLKMDKNGRSNIVIFGTSEDDEGGNHPGAYLTDSILIASIDQNKKNAFTYSIPRDLWVQYDATCNAGTEGRINEVYQCYSDSGKKEAAGSNALRKTLTEVTGMEIQYYAHVNYSVVRDAVDAVGGVSVNIESDDPRGILDRNFDWKCDYQCNFVKYENGPTGNLDGEHALALARARNARDPSFGDYGLGRGNYDREVNQQKILKALQSKALSAGTLTNFGKVTKLVDAFGKNLRTNFEPSEFRTLTKLAQDIPTDKVEPIDIQSATPAVFMGETIGGAQIQRASSGLYDYSSIQNYLQRTISSDPAVRENAKIGVYNGTETNGLAQTTADSLKALGLTVSDVGNAPDGTYAAYEVYDVTGEKAATKAKLEKKYGITAKSGPAPIQTTGLDFVVIVGKTPAE